MRIKGINGYKYLSFWGLSVGILKIEYAKLNDWFVWHIPSFWHRYDLSFGMFIGMATGI
jgi:hypothetical protein